MDSIKTVITGLNEMNTAEGERVGFTYSKMTEDGKIIRQNAKASLILTNEEISGKFADIKAYLKEWVERNENE